MSYRDQRAGKIGAMIEDFTEACTAYPDDAALTAYAAAADRLAEQLAELLALAGASADPLALTYAYAALSEAVRTVAVRQPELGDTLEVAGEAIAYGGEV